MDVHDLIENLTSENQDTRFSSDLDLLTNNIRLFRHLQEVHDHVDNWKTSSRMRNAFNEAVEFFDLTPLDETYRFADR